MFLAKGSFMPCLLLFSLLDLTWILGCRCLLWTPEERYYYQSDPLFSSQLSWEPNSAPELRMECRAPLPAHPGDPAGPSAVPVLPWWTRSVSTSATWTSSGSTLPSASYRMDWEVLPGPSVPWKTYFPIRPQTRQLDVSALTKKTRSAGISAKQEKNSGPKVPCRKA